MASIKLKSPQEIVDNINKIQKGDLLFISIPKELNPITKKCFLIGTALNKPEIHKLETNGNQKYKSNKFNYYIYLLVGDKFVGLHYRSRIKYISRLKQRKLEIEFRSCNEYQSFINSYKGLKGF